MFVLAVLLGTVPAADAYFSGGGKDVAKGNDCLIGYESVDVSDVISVRDKQVVQCGDGDLACDDDGSSEPNGSCTFNVRFCTNQPGVEGCEPPASLDKVRAKAKVKGSPGTVQVATPPLEGAVCSPGGTIVVPITGKKDPNGSVTVTLAASVKGNKAEGIPARRDKDKLVLSCVRCVATSGTFCDHGNGTISDSATGLQWEKKTTTLGSGSNAADLHDVDNFYQWAGKCSVTTDKYCQPNSVAEMACKAETSNEYWEYGCEQCAEVEGVCVMDGAITTIWDWLSQVNAANFAGHGDWRVPSESGCDSCWTGSPTYACTSCSSHELETILLSPYPCRPCVDPIFGPTGRHIYWSASTYARQPTVAWGVLFEFDRGDVLLQDKTGGPYVRAVRTLGDAVEIDPKRER